MNAERITEEMHALESKLGYTFQNIELLAKAMQSVKLERRVQDGEHSREYSNESLAFLGDTIIKFLIARKLFAHDKRKGDMTEEKKTLEGNDTFHKIMKEEGLIGYAYHDTHFRKDDPPHHEQVIHSRHDPYIEAITAAIFLDSDWPGVTAWFESWLYPRLERYRTLS